MAAETVIVDEATRAAQQMGGGLLSGIGSFAWGLVTSPINTFATIGRSAFNGVVSWGIPAALGTTAVAFLTPDAIRPALSAIGREDWADALGDAAREGGPGKVALIAAGTGAALAGGIGAVSGVVQSVTGGGQAEGEAPPSMGARIGQGVGTLVTFGAIIAVAVGAVNNDGIAHDASADGVDIIPPLPSRSGADRQAAV